MEKSEKIIVSEKPEQSRGVGGGSCPIWIFGNEESAENDLMQKFEIKDE